MRKLALRPNANRFVVGRRIYKRRTIDVSFVVKRELTEEASETNLKISFDPRSMIADVVERLTSARQETKRSSTSADEKMSNTITSLPRILIRLIIWGVRALDYFGSLPASFIKGDSLYTRAYLANLGSIGLDAVSHHMLEWGNAVFSIVVGKRNKEPVINERGEIEAQEVVDMNISLDKLITDSVNYATTIRLLSDLIENPEKLGVPPENLPDPFALA